MTDAFRLLVTGTRDATPRHLHEVGAVLLDEVRFRHHRGSIVVARHGAARGLDQLVTKIAESTGWEIDPHPADWTGLGRAAGFIRNQRMVDKGNDLCVGLPARPSGGRGGTWDCIHRAADAGITVIVHSLDVSDQSER